MQCDWIRASAPALGLLAALSLLAPAAAEDAPRFVRPSVEELAIPHEKPANAARETEAREAMCLMIESAARAEGLPLEFFARVIWQESRFQSDAVGPVTRSGQRAQGIAQFMPGTASERGLLDPFNPVQALPKSAEFLAELRNQFGNLGLAAAAYNAGPRRVQEWLAGTGPMPLETRNYVSAITGSTVEDWAKAGRTGKMPERPATSSCRELMALLRRAPNPFVAGLEQHVTLSAAKLWGVQLAAGFSRDKALAMYSRAMKRLSRRDRRSGSEPAEFAAAQPRHATVLSGAHRRRHAGRGRQSLQPHPQGGRGVLRAEEYGGAGLASPNSRGEWRIYNRSIGSF